MVAKALKFFHEYAVKCVHLFLWKKNALLLPEKTVKGMYLVPEQINRGCQMK